MAAVSPIGENCNNWETKVVVFHFVLVDRCALYFDFKCLILSPSLQVNLIEKNRKGFNARMPKPVSFDRSTENGQRGVK